MIPLDGNMSIRVAVILGFALGVLFGGIGAYILLGRHGDTAKLQAELDELRERFSDYRDQVTRHFMSHLRTGPGNDPELPRRP